MCREVRRLAAEGDSEGWGGGEGAGMQVLGMQGPMESGDRICSASYADGMACCSLGIAVYHACVGREL